MTFFCFWDRKTFEIRHKTILNFEYRILLFNNERRQNFFQNHYVDFHLEQFSSVESYWLAKEWIATAASLKWMRNPAYYIKNLPHSSIYWSSSSDPPRFIWGPRSPFVTRIFSSDQVIFVLRCHFDLISSRSHIHLRIHWSLDNLENQ